MSITINVNINAPELANAIQALAAALSGTKAGSSNNGNGTRGKSKPTLVSNPELKPEPEPKSEPEPEPEAPLADEKPEVALEEVRAKLAAISQAGKQAQVKQLLNKFGASKLTEVPVNQYGELLAEAGKIA